jgi:hypothetical protein
MSFVYFNKIRKKFTRNRPQIRHVSCDTEWDRTNLASGTHAPPCLYTRGKIKRRQVYFKPCQRLYMPDKSSGFPTHTLRLSFRLKSVQANRTAKRNVCGGLYNPAGKRDLGQPRKRWSSLSSVGNGIWAQSLLWYKKKHVYICHWSLSWISHFNIILSVLYST